MTSSELLARVRAQAQKPWEECTPSARDQRIMRNYMGMAAYSVMFEAMKLNPEDYREYMMWTALDLGVLEPLLAPIDKKVSRVFRSLCFDFIGSYPEGFRAKIIYDDLAVLLEHAEKTYGPFNVPYDDPEADMSDA